MPATPESRRDRIQRQAVEIARRYKTAGAVHGRETLFLLLDLATFFDLYHAGKLNESLDTLTRVKILPMSPTQVDLSVSNFRQLGDEVRRNVPDLLLAMTALHSQYRGGSGGRENIREKARGLITYA